jgi:hypothetical protein
MKNSGEKKQPSFSVKVGRILKNRYFWISLIVLIIAYISTFLADQYLANKYGNKLPILDDLIFNILPYLKIAWLYDLCVIAIVILFLVYTFKKEYTSIPYFMISIGIIYLVRVIFTILTPIGVPNGGGNGIFTDVTSMFGAYPSGHTGLAFLIVLFTRGIYKKISIILFALLAATLLLARGHYSIDILSAVFFAYAIYSFGERYLRDKLKI